MSAESRPLRRCGDSGGMTKAGTPCRSALGLDDAKGLCPHHDPLRAELMRETRAKGGRKAHEVRRRMKAALPHEVPKPPKTLQDAVAWSSWAMYAVATGEIDARTGHEVGYLVNAFKAAVEKRDLLTEIERLREELAEARKGRLQAI